MTPFLYPGLSHSVYGGLPGVDAARGGARTADLIVKLPILVFQLPFGSSVREDSFEKNEK